MFKTVGLTGKITNAKNEFAFPHLKSSENKYIVFWLPVKAIHYLKMTLVSCNPHLLLVSVSNRLQDNFIYL